MDVDVKMFYETQYPYLEPLLIFLQNHAKLKKIFTEKDFFRPMSEIDLGIDALLDKGSNCLDVKSIWVGPQNSTALNQNGCNLGRNHNFQIIINIPCGEGPFFWEKGNDSKIYLGGSFMQLSHYMRMAALAVNDFNSYLNREKNDLLSNITYDNIVYLGDKIIHPARNTNFMSGILDFRITIY